jgi:hypothetical protein
MWSRFTGGVFMVSLISLQAPYHALDRHQFHLARAWGGAAGRVSAAEPNDFTRDRLGHANELHRALSAR